MKNYVLAIDQSTQNTKAILIDKEGKIRAKAAYSHKQYYPAAGRIEQDGEEIYQNACRAIGDVLEMEGAAPEEIFSLGITNQTGAFVLWDRKTGMPVGRIVGWQDDRGKALEPELSTKVKTLFQEVTGSDVNGYLPALKVKVLLDENPELSAMAASGELLFGTMECWLIFRLTAGRVHACDYGNACITQLFDYRKKCWSEELLDFAGLPVSAMPKLIASDEAVGSVSDGPALGIQIQGVLGDSNAALFGQCGFEKGTAKITFGTGASMLINTGEEPCEGTNGLNPVLAWSRNGRATYILEGTVVSCGTTIAWLKDKLELISRESETEELARSVPDTDGVVFVPAFVGLGTPYWNGDVRTMIRGIGADTSKAHIVRAALEGIGLEVAELVFAADESHRPKLILADGGMSRNGFLMQFISDVTQLPLIVSDVEESSAFGAALMSGLCSGMWAKEEMLTSLLPERREYLPVLKPEEARCRLNAWKKVIKDLIGQ